MAGTRFDIASQAMGLMRANSVNSFDEGTNEADICNLFYDDWALDMLTRYPWSFATKKRKFNQDSTAPLTRYSYSHIVPGEALRIWAVYASNSPNDQPIKDYEIIGTDGGRRIISNYPELWVDYTVYTDESNWPGYFTGFAIHSFAALTAQSVTDQPDLAARLHQLAWGTAAENELGGKFGVACRIDAHQKPGPTIQASPVIDARFS